VYSKSTDEEEAGKEILPGGYRWVGGILARECKSERNIANESNAIIIKDTEARSAAATRDQFPSRFLTSHDYRQRF
jgi:hypothetical protein